MHHRALVLVGIVTLIAAVPVVGQEPSGAANEAVEQAAYSVPRTPDGQPDLQGFWTNQTYTPLERPDSVAKAFYTPEEAAAIEQGRAVRESSQTTPGTIPDVHYDFTQFGLDRSQSPFARNLRTSLIVDPPDGRLPPATPEEEARQRARTDSYIGARFDSLEDFNAFDRCITRGLPGAMMPGFYNHNYHILQTPDYVALVVEMIHDARIIPLDGRGHAPAGIRQWLGDSRGRWEGDTLVVETTNFNARILRRGGTVLGGDERLHVVERLRRVDADTIDYQVTVTDPTVWTAPWTASIPMNRRAEGTLFEYACHEGKYGLTNSLTGARAAEEKSR